MYFLSKHAKAMIVKIFSCGEGTSEELEDGPHSRTYVQLNIHECDLECHRWWYDTLKKLTPIFFSILYWLSDTLSGDEKAAQKED